MKHNTQLSQLARVDGLAFFLLLSTKLLPLWSGLIGRGLVLPMEQTPALLGDSQRIE
jgi:hypothetical protein